MTSMASQHQSPMARVVDGLKAIAMGLLAQVLMFGLEMAMELSHFPFPSSILAMFVLFLFLLTCGYFWDGFEDFYETHLRQPANLLNRHMSIGFSVPIVMLAQQSVASGDTIARIIACFIIAGVLSAVLVYLLAISTQRLVELCTRYLSGLRRGGRLVDEESAAPAQEDRPTNRHLSVILGKPTASPSQLSSVVSFPDLAQSGNGYSSPEEYRDNASSPLPHVPEKNQPDGISPPRSALHKLISWAVTHPLLILCWLTTITITLPLRYTTSLEAPLGISLLLSIWATVLVVQSGIKSSTASSFPPLKPEIRTVLSVLCNPVLFTALGLLAYASAESHRSGRDLATILSTLEQDTTFTDLVMHRTPSPDAGGYFSTTFDNDTGNPESDIPYSQRDVPSLGASDVANAILSAGLVCWGLKLWEYRRRLLSSAGATILLVSCLAALVNVVCGPLLAREVLGPWGESRYDLAFVARSVTLALGAPAVERLGGDVGLNAAMVVVNGIICQMVLGVGVGRWAGRSIDGARRRVGRWFDLLAFPWRRSNETAREEKPGGAREGVRSPITTGVPSSNKQSPSETQAKPIEATTSPDQLSQSQQEATQEAAGNHTSIGTIAAGVTVGINAAAMGTAQLYESGSDAAPYAALAMTVFGVATVGFTMVSQLGGWVVMMVQ